MGRGRQTFDRYNSEFQGSSFGLSRRSRSLSGVSFDTSSISSLKAHSRSSLSLRSRKYKKRKRGKFNCFHCSEEIKANKYHDGVYRSIYRPSYEGFVKRVLPSGELLSAYLITSKKSEHDMKPISFQTQDSFQNNLIYSKGQGSGTMKSFLNHFSNKKSQFHKSKKQVGFNSNSEVPLNKFNQNSYFLSFKCNSKN